ncbi:intraflagellar transport protein 81 homolog [Photinus pyralis]|nr:intraflagellar transport protein 81 homolog [Photinus pyralis]XP_031327514.1 intraflagellar transport protein 81 homolog [Photinus pyralis]
MAEETKFIITELNKLLNREYNLSSFESLSKDELLSIVCDVLVVLDVIPKGEYDSNSAVSIIFDALQNIKYSPPDDVDPEEFLNGISLGNKSIIRIIVHWLLSKPEQVRKRAYLSKYVEKIECPPEILDDVEVGVLYAQYESLIEEFWKVYNENKKEEKLAVEAEELQHDISKMEEDSLKLHQRIEQQMRKIENIPHKEGLIAMVRSYRNEVNEQNKLEQQILEQQNLEVQMENELKELKEILLHKQTRHGNKVELVQLIADEVNTNNIIADQLADELKHVKQEMDLCESLIRGPEPSEANINDLTAELAKLNDEVQNLIENKMSTIDVSSDNQLVAFRNQATIIANKKQEVSKSVMELKSKMNSIQDEIVEKEDLLKTLIGGPLLQGDNLKKYVSKLRAQNILYKEYKGQLSALTTEIGILNRTVDILKSTDPSFDELLKGESVNHEAHFAKTSADTNDLKEEFKSISEESDRVRAETAQLREELKVCMADLEPILNEYNQYKENFEEVTKMSSNQLKQINEEISTLEEEIKTQEEKWKSMQRENQRKEELLVRLSEDIINSGDVLNTQPSQVSILEGKLEQQVKIKNMLADELSNLELQKVESREMLVRLDEIIMLLKAKLKYSSA